MCQDKSQEIFFWSVKHALKLDVCILRYTYADETVFELQGKNGLQLSSGCEDPIKECFCKKCCAHRNEKKKKVLIVHRLQPCSLMISYMESEVSNIRTSMSD